jgi:dephospho-CoA kinase
VVLVAVKQLPATGLKQGIQVVDADVVAREVVQVGQPALLQIQQLW